MSQLYALMPADLNSGARSCDCLAHVYGNAADHPDRARRYPSDMTDAGVVTLADRPEMILELIVPGRGSSVSPSCKGHRYPVEIISHCVWLCFRFPLSFREVKELMLERGVIVSRDDPPVVSEVRAVLRQRAAPPACEAGR